MAATVRDLMTRDPRTVDADQPLMDAARLMRDHDIGSVIVTTTDGGICGIVTDRDITVRAVAEGADVASTPVEQACSHSIEAVGPESTADEVAALMRDHALRRIPVVEDGKPVGIISLGDLEMERHPDSTLGEISEAPPNN
jgi:CBS domain-containing protein